jgi:hypothetical protein
MSELSTKDLFTQLQNKLIIKLEENEIVCPECKGLTFVLKLSGEHGHIERCPRCYTGKLTVCKHCGNSNKSWCQCKGAVDERDEKRRIEQAKKEHEAYQKAEKIHYKDYDGKFILPNSDYIQDIDGVSDWIYDLLTEGEEPPEYLWALVSHPHFSINIYDVISDKCEDGYEEMYSHLDTGSPLLSQAQELISQWEKEQGGSLCIFNETYKKAVIIKDLVEEIRAEIKGQHQEYLNSVLDPRD